MIYIIDEANTNEYIKISFLNDYIHSKLPIYANIHHHAETKHHIWEWIQIIDLKAPDKGTAYIYLQCKNIYIYIST